MKSFEVHVEGAREGESEKIATVLDRSGFVVTADEETGLITASRPPTIDKDEFLSAAVKRGVDQGKAASNAWNNLRNLHWAKTLLVNSFDQNTSKPLPPIKMIQGGWNTGTGNSATPYTLVVSETLSPTAEWAGLWGLPGVRVTELAREIWFEVAEYVAGETE